MLRDECLRRGGPPDLALTAGLAAALALRAFAAPVPDNPIFPLPTLEPVPLAVEGVRQHVISLNGTWKINRDPPAEFWKNDLDEASWSAAVVPAPFRRETVRAEQPYAYRKKFTLPADFAGHRAILRFEGVSNEARVWINGQFVREHWGTFMAWSCDITRFVNPGTDATIAVGVDDRPVGLAQFVRSGGILRDVRVFAVPADHLTRLQVETNFDGQYRDALLKLRLRMAFGAGRRASVRLRLSGADGAAVALATDIVTLSSDEPETIVSIPVASPMKWDAEHPNLYRLEATVMGPLGETLETLSHEVGFREVRVVGNRMLVNGREVKLRGVWGNGDVARLKQFNVNHSRQKYASEAFFDDADRLGLYVLDEVPVDFAKYGAESDPRYADLWLGLIAELMERDRSHPS
ncbi:MAG TPA: hypothetical protein VKG78_09880, partial [Opitutaceae bacterium]|nr:hypothetical protein [Opitutaceae bacterium]